ncbi:MAG: calcium-binding protein, partial [Synechococcaceae cyanobacterium]
SVTVQDYFGSSALRIEQFRFSDGVLWDHAALVDQLQLGGATAGNDQLGGYNDTPNRVDGLEGHDRLFGGDLNDLLRGGAGNDMLLSGAGDDLLDGGIGNDILRGAAGRDTLIGAPGDDLLEGSIGADLYRIARGDGQDRIYDEDSNLNNVDEVLFSGLSSAEVSGVLRQYNELRLNFSSGDSVTVQDYFVSSALRIEQFRFSDGVLWDHPELMARLTTLA